MKKPVIYLSAAAIILLPFGYYLIRPFANDEDRPLSGELFQGMTPEQRAVVEITQDALEAGK